MAVVLVLVASAIGIVLGFASRKPPTFRVARDTVINASPDRIRPLIDDFHEWAAWSPFEKLDPAMSKTFTGPESGVGAGYSWTGNKKAGAGSMTISGVEEGASHQVVAIAMQFLKPFKSQSDVRFLIDAAPESPSASRVTWEMTGKNQFASKVMSVFVSMDKLVGKDFAEGLANLKRVAESDR